jgi:hypothetical protein
MSAFVVDVNVPIVANGRSPQADDDCVIACVGALTEIQESGIVVLDDGMRILDEYIRNLSMSGQPGLGDSFMKWIWENQAVDAHCERVRLTPRGGDPDEFAEFPDDSALAGFDRSDRKYVAVALKSRLNPEILNAVDRHWRDSRPALEAKGLRVTLLCPQCMR